MTRFGLSQFFKVKVLETPPLTYVLSINDGDRDVLKEGYQAVPGHEAALRVVVSDSPGVISGRLVDSNGKSVSPGVVVRIPDDPEKSHRVEAKNTGVNGEFTVYAEPGSYHLYGWRELQRAPYYDPDFMKGYVGHGCRVRLEPNGVARIDLKASED